MVSALGQNDRYNRYISAFLERLLRVTAELIEMAQYEYASLTYDGVRLNLHERSDEIQSW